jgi:S1-C subfamily serine protease
MSSSEKPLLPWRKIGTHALAVILSVLTVTAFQVFPNPLIPNLSFSSNQSVALAAELNNIPVSPGNTHSFIAAAVQRVGPAVVRIETETTITKKVQDPFFDDPFFRGFFGEDILPNDPQEYHEQGEGSGFIVESNGIIITNAHVVSGADKVTVTLKDGRTFKGEVRGIDQLSDLAVVKIDGENLPVAPLGDSSALQVGDWAIAVGNPLGLENTVTLGIISTLNRSSAQVGIPDKRLDFIQTDAAINPGNSGGPLVNAQGEVIGINTAIRADAQGIGFAIPIDKAKSIQEQLARGEKVSHPYIGISMIPLTPSIAKEYNKDPNTAFMLPEINGVLVVKVMPKSPAAAGGFRRGDVVTDIDGQTITSPEQLQNFVENSKIGQPLSIKVRRSGQTQVLTVRPAQMKE